VWCRMSKYNKSVSCSQSQSCRRKADSTPDTGAETAKPKKRRKSRISWHRRENPQLSYEPSKDNDEDSLDSADIIRRNRGQDLEAQQEWHKSYPYLRLGPDSQNNNTGIWIPHWVGKSLRNPRQARLLSHILWWFDVPGSNSPQADRGDIYIEERFRGQPRARFVDPEGQRWLLTSERELSREILLPRATVSRGLLALARRALVEINRNLDPNEGFLVRPLAKPLAKAFYRITKSEVAYKEFLAPDSSYPSRILKQKRWQSESGPLASKIIPGWGESETSKHAMNRNPMVGIPVVRGVFVPDLVMLACERNAGPAYLLSQILWWFGLGENGRPRPQIVRDGFRWIAKSPRLWSRELGPDESCIRRWLDYLVQSGFIDRRLWYFHKRKCFGRKTLHLRPCPYRLHQVIEDVDDYEVEAFRKDKCM